MRADGCCIQVRERPNYVCNAKGRIGGGYGAGCLEHLDMNGIQYPDYTRV
jgi:hypothetical protein